MKKLISLLLIAFFFSGCKFVHRMDVEQGNIITQDKVNQLHPGMSMSEVKRLMGNPVMQNIFTPERIEYVYTMQKGHAKLKERRIICIFRGDILKEVMEF